jgi:hypothetical protein
VETACAYWYVLGKIHKIAWGAMSRIMGQVIHMIKSHDLDTSLVQFPVSVPVPAFGGF